MRNLIVGALVTVWGLGVVINGLFINPPQGGGSYASGQVTGIAIGAILAVLGVRTVIKAFRAR